MLQKTMLIFYMMTTLVSAFELNTPETKLFSGSIEFPHTMTYDLCLFYNGQKLDFEGNNTNKFLQFSFLDYSKTQLVYFIITNGLSCCTSESNNVDCLSILDESSYICYKMQAKRELDPNDQQILTWEILPHQLTNGQIPHNSLIFLFDPTLIAGLKVQSWKPENIFRIIPTLLIHPSASAEQLQRAMIIARLAALDIDALHSKTSFNNPAHAVLTSMH
mgnify:FL=1